ncbi:MAG: hypothetical protein QOK40_2778, partial [Miltoncostaeaceae bacterium]|nr:hypothetical protein [Miltoncostaeaceae bacterium]
TGEAVAAWEYRSGTPGTLIQVARLPSPSARWRSGATFASAPPGSIRPTLGFDDGGALTASWYWNGVVQTASRPALGTFSAARTLTAPGPGVDAPALAVGALGDAVVAWDRFADPVRTIESASRAPGGDWAPPERIAPVETAPNPGPYLSPPSVALDSSGRATALWGIAGAGDAFRILTADRPAGGPWSAPFLLEDARLINGPLRMAGNPAGGAVAAWPGRGPRGRSVVRVSARPAGGATWSAPVTLSSPAREAGQPSIALDRAGDAAVGWTERLATGGSIVRVALRVAGAGSWQAAQTIGGAERRPRGIEGFLTASLPGVAFGGRRLTAVWTECSLARGSRIQLFVERCAIRSTSRALPRGG